MAGWVKLERVVITKLDKDGAIMKTLPVGFQWFLIEQQPACYKPDEKGEMWCTTTDYHFGPEPPS